MMWTQRAIASGRLIYFNRKTNTPNRENILLSKKSTRIHSFLTEQWAESKQAKRIQNNKNENKKFIMKMGRLNGPFLTWILRSVQVKWHFIERHKRTKEDNQQLDLASSLIELKSSLERTGNIIVLRFFFPINWFSQLRQSAKDSLRNDLNWLSLEIPLMRAIEHFSKSTNGSNRDDVVRSST